MQSSLSNQGIKTLGELIVYTENDLKSFPNMGRTSIEEIKMYIRGFFFIPRYEFRTNNFEENNNTVEPENKEWTISFKKITSRIDQRF